MLEKVKDHVKKNADVCIISVVMGAIIGMSYYAGAKSGVRNMTNYFYWFASKYPDLTFADVTIPKV